MPQRPPRMRNTTKIVNPQNCRSENTLLYLPDTTAPAGAAFTLQLYRCVAEIKQEGGAWRWVWSRRGLWSGIRRWTGDRRVWPSKRWYEIVFIIWWSWTTSCSEMFLWLNKIRLVSRGRGSTKCRSFEGFDPDSSVVHFRQQKPFCYSQETIIVIV